VAARLLKKISNFCQWHQLWQRSSRYVSYLPSQFI